MTDQDFDAAIERVHQASSRRRATAWAAVPERVLGLGLSPLTPASLSLLYGTRNAFVCGLPPVEADVENFILFHSPEFDTDNPRPKILDRFRIAWRTQRALCPVRILQNRRNAFRAQNILRAIREIRDIIERAFSDALPPLTEDDPSPSVAADMVAQLCDSFAFEYQFWPLPQPIRHTPIAQLFQLARCIDRRRLGGDAIYFDRDEAALTRDFLKAANADNS